MQTMPTQSGHITAINPRKGSLQGGTQITVSGRGFSSNQFNHFPGTEHLGNKVFFVSKHYVFPCDVIVEKTDTSRIVCITRSGMGQDNYDVKVTVDGTDIPNECRSSSDCQFQPSLTSTPTVSAITPSSGPPGSLLTLKGRIFTSKYGLNASTNGNSNEISRYVSGYSLLRTTLIN
ncbi:Fibrocystin-L [Mizuhopecten yessoensis]|uniref:Fibrocystin-L n=1 Tax=Mizuhopecten yessoensis TaxID=6573 RepID=A0A210QH36_MIZYE|nr:Fibrocystin-L [Mizuhopecten yessoensis]